MSKIIIEVPDSCNEKGNGKCKYLYYNTYHEFHYCRLFPDDGYDVDTRGKVAKPCPACRKAQEEYSCIEDMIKFAKHIHENRQDGTDYCKKCGHDLRHPIHLRVGE